jgi:VanZ family protein
VNKLNFQRGFSRIVLFQYWLPLVAWWFVMQCLSTDTFSAGETSKYFIPVLHFFFPGMSAPDIEFWHFVFRKASHVTEYFILGVLALRAFGHDQPSRLRAVLVTLFFVVVAASGDEFHQTFTRYRTGAIGDVGYDALGGLVALFLFARKASSSMRKAEETR